MTTQRASTKRSLFFLLMLVSGFCGISYEVLYARVIGNLLGDQFLVSGSVLLVFLVGIGVGTLAAHRLWRFLWAIEASIGAWGVLFTFLSPTLDKGLYAAGAGPLWVVFACLVALCPAAFLIGCSVPLFAGYAAAREPGRSFATVYGLYNVGAALTALLIEFCALRVLGLRGAVLLVAALNGVVALALYAGYGDLREKRPAALETTKTGARALVALGLASVASAIFQLLMIKIAECVFGPFRETFAVVLALSLGGIAVGSAVVGRLRLTFSRVLVLALVGLAALLFGFGALAHGHASIAPWASQSHALAALEKLGVCAVMMGLPVVCFGAIIPAMLVDERSVARDSGRLLFVSSMANGLGFLAMIAGLHERFDYGTLLVIVTGLVTVSLLVAAGPRARVAPVGLALALSAVLAHRLVWRESLLFVGHTNFASKEDLAEAERNYDHAETFRGAHDVFSITYIAKRPHFFINGFVSIALDSPSEKVVGAFSSIFAPRRDKALVLGVGSGATAGTVARLFDATDAVEINPVVLANLGRMKEYNFDLESVAGARLIHDDAIHFLKAATGSYAMILNTVTSPLFFSSSKLYTRDFFKIVKSHLDRDGVYVTWFDSRVGDRGADIILKSVGEEFEHCILGAVRSTYWLLVCSNAEVRAHRPDAAAREPVLAAYFKGEGIDPSRLAYGVISADALALRRDPAITDNTLDFPALEFEIATRRKRGLVDLKKHLVDSLDLEPIKDLFDADFAFDPRVGAKYQATLVGKDSIAKRYQKLAAQVTD